MDARRRRRRPTALCGYAIQDGIESKDNDTVPVPATTAALRGITQGLSRPAGSLDFLQLSLSEKRDDLAVRGPERVISTLRSSKRMRSERIPAPHPERRLLPRGRDDQGQLRAIRRDGQR